MPSHPVCPICEIRPPAAHSIYCRLCGKFILHKPEAAARAACMKRQRTPDGGFFCYYTHERLELADASDPWYANFDHRTPGKKGDIAMCVWWLNDMKGELDEDEFWAVVLAYADHLDGKPFPFELTRFKYWSATGRRRAGRALSFPAALRTNAPCCEICGRPPLPRAKYCAVCSAFVYRAGENLERVAAMKAACRDGIFYCHYTGLPLNLTDPDDPLYLNFDHLVPGRKGRLVACAAFINRMKTALSEEEFNLLMRELARFRREGGSFNRDVVRFLYWRTKSKLGIIRPVERRK